MDFFIFWYDLIITLVIITMGVVIIILFFSNLFFIIFILFTIIIIIHYYLLIFLFYLFHLSICFIDVIVSDVLYLCFVLDPLGNEMIHLKQLSIK